MAKVKGRSQKLLGLEERLVKDYDPEADVPDDSDESGSDDGVDETAGTEHYETVGKSKLRRKDQVALGPQYQGVRISRTALDGDEDDEDDGEETEEEAGEGVGESSSRSASDYEDAREDFDDPDTADLEADQVVQDDAEIDSDNAFDEKDEEKFRDFVFRGSAQAAPKKGRRVARPTAADYMASESEEEELDDDDEGSDDEGMLNGEESSGSEEMGGFIDEEASESEEEDEEEGGIVAGDMDDDSEDDDSEEEESDPEDPAEVNGANRASMKELMSAGQRSVASSLSNALQQDVAKGKAVRQQRKAFDALLNIRIRLQKSMVAVNSLNSVEESEDQSEPYEAAEAAALKLWNSIDTFRSSVQTDSAKAGQKRKRTANADTSSQKIWEDMQALEHQAVARRRAVLEKWSNSAKNMRTVDRSSRKFTSNSDKPLTTMLDEELGAPERLVKRTRTPRSCAPVQVAQKINEDPNIYDDADFYQLLLKELVDQRTGDASGAGMQAATVRYAAVKEAKAKRHVDTKASKGRKMRFGVHEKLQNFMAAEDRRDWEQSAIDRLFGTLFGQKLVLNEDELSDDAMGGVPVEEEGLRLFRS